MLTLEMQKLIKQTNQARDQTTCVTTKFSPLGTQICSRAPGALLDYRLVTHNNIHTIWSDRPSTRLRISKTTSSSLSFDAYLT